MRELRICAFVALLSLCYCGVSLIPSMIDSTIQSISGGPAEVPPSSLVIPNHNPFPDAEAAQEDMIWIHEHKPRLPPEIKLKVEEHLRAAALTFLHSKRRYKDPEGLKHLIIAKQLVESNR